VRILVLAHGRRADPELVALFDDYQRRSRTALPFELVFCPTGAQQWAKARAQPGKIVLLDERGESLSSRELAARIDGWRGASVRQLALMIGGADGFDDAEREAADGLLSLSRMTLPHRLAQLVLCEQLYRAGTILSGHPYHHG
jgi:23S rRNA (pseudouridine1915-N3)-methyltransferase